MNIQYNLTKKSPAGFTFIELLLVIALLAVLAAATIIAINPARQLAKSRDAERSVSVFSILSAVYQYANDHDGTFVNDITSDGLEICRTDSTDCTGLYDFSILTDNQNYLVSMPIDPLCFNDEQSCGANGTGYFIAVTAGNKISVSAPNTEGDSLITVTR